MLNPYQEGFNAGCEHVRRNEVEMLIESVKDLIRVFEQYL